MTEGHRTLATLNALTLHEVAREVSPERELVQFTLKVKQGTGPKEPVYKIKVTRFHSGTVDEWIDILDALDEIWKQNSLNKPNDMECVLKLVVRDEHQATNFATKESKQLSKGLKSKSGSNGDNSFGASHAETLQGIVIF